MAITVEDGTGVSNANSFCTIAEAKTYHAERGNADAWDAVDDQAAALIKATDFMEQKFRRRWKGYRASAIQRLSWPREFVYLEPFARGSEGAYPYLMASNIVPAEVKAACAELALRAAADTLWPDQERGVRSQTVGPITTVYDTNDPASPRFSAVDATLAHLLGGSPYNVEVVAT